MSGQPFEQGFVVVSVVGLVVVAEVVVRQSQSSSSWTVIALLSNASVVSRQSSGR
jgi:hypothetical protein